MLGILYLILCFAVGAVICSCIFPKLYDMAAYTYDGKRTDIPYIFIAFPAWYFTGTLVMSWSSYLFGYAFRKSSEPLKPADTIVFILALAVIILYYIRKRLRRVNTDFGSVCANSNISINIYQAVYILSALVLTSALMFRTFYIKDGQLCVGLSVFSDFSPHLGMIRSFSYGNNFPTQYAHFAGADIKYHFMFQFFVGNLEYLGLRIDYAFNLPSIFNMLGVYCLLYVLAVKITNKNAVGITAGLLFTFRSSPSLFKYIAGLPKGNIIKGLTENIEFIGETPNEGWGLWNLNVYCNQRHFAFSLSIMLFALIVFLEHYYKQRKRFVSLKTTALLDKKYTAKRGTKYFKFIIKEWLIVKEGWQILDIKRAVFMGVLLGMSAFFNGAVLICTLAVLFVSAAASDNRLEILITAVIATIMSLIETSFFIDGNAVSPKYFFGFIAENKTLFGVLLYIVELTGIVFLVVGAALIILRGSEKYLIFAFLIPFILAFTLSLTPDVTVNHKNIMISLMLIGIFEADVLVRLFNVKGIFAKAAAAILIIMLTFTGVYDGVVVFKRNADVNNLKYNLNDELMLWVKENTNSQDIFLTNNDYLNGMVLGGAMLYDGWQYYAWSAGYDISYRDAMVAQMYGAESVYELDRLIKQENIRYIVVNYSNRTSEGYVLNEEVIDSAYERVYESGEGEWAVYIYDTKKNKQILEQ